MFGVYKAGAKKRAILARLHSNAHVSGQRVLSDLVSKGYTTIPQIKSFVKEDSHTNRKRKCRTLDTSDHPGRKGWQNIIILLAVRIHYFKGIFLFRIAGLRGLSLFIF
jgi:hypothetical protein